MAIPFLVSIRFLCRACLSRLLGEFVWGAAHSFRLFVFFFVREFLYELDCWSDVTVWKCNNALRHALQRDAMGGLHTFVGQQPEIFMAVERMRRRRISIRFTVVLRMWLGTFARRSLRYVGGKMKMRVADT